MRIFFSGCIVFKEYRCTSSSQIKALHFLKQVVVRVPEDISLTGGDRIDLACDLSMTGIIQEYETLAGKALRLIKKSSGKNRWKKM